MLTLTVPGIAISSSVSGFITQKETLIHLINRILQIRVGGVVYAEE